MVMLPAKPTRASSNSKTGMHKHFRMIALSEYLRNHGYDEKHTRIPGIWEKLKTMYNMEMIDEREDTFDDEGEEGDEDTPPFVDFELPEEEYGLETFMRGKRSPSEAPSSPPRLERSSSPPPTMRRKRGEAASHPKTRASTVEDTDEARTSPPAKTTRAGRSSTRSQVRAKRGSTSRAPSKDTTMDEDEGAEETEETAEEEEEAAEEKSASPRPARGGSKAKADAATRNANPSRKSKRKR